MSQNSTNISNSEKVTAQEVNAEKAFLDIKIRFKCFCFSLSINHNFEKLRENPRLINGKVDSNPPPPHNSDIVYSIILLLLDFQINIINCI